MSGLRRPATGAHAFFPAKSPAEDPSTASELTAVISSLGKKTMAGQGKVSTSCWPELGEDSVMLVLSSAHVRAHCGDFAARPQGYPRGHWSVETGLYADRLPRIGLRSVGEVRCRTRLQWAPSRRIHSDSGALVAKRRSSPDVDGKSSLGWCPRHACFCGLFSEPQRSALNTRQVVIGARAQNSGAKRPISGGVGLPDHVAPRIRAAEGRSERQGHDGISTACSYEIARVAHVGMGSGCRLVGCAARNHCFKMSKGPAKMLSLCWCDHQDLNLRPPRCERGALPTELWSRVGAVCTDVLPKAQGRPSNRPLRGRSRDKPAFVCGV